MRAFDTVGSGKGWPEHRAPVIWHDDPDGPILISVEGYPDGLHFECLIGICEMSGDATFTCEWDEPPEITEARARLTDTPVPDYFAGV